MNEEEIFTLNDAGPGPADEKPGLYVHVPFCRRKCPYCDFYSITSVSWADAWLEALQLESDRYRQSFSTFDTLYIGGGTPSALEPGQVARLFALLRSRFDFEVGSEITLEANPDDVTSEKLAAWQDAGVTRISVGVQSFDEKEVVFLGRRHTAARALEALEAIRRAGFAAVGIDLMYGLPGQTLDRWMLSLGIALEHQPEHISCYQLTVEGKTPFGRLEEKGLLELPDEEDGRRFFLETSRFLRSAGYVHYEISNFARSGKHVARHNSKYWKHMDYLGLGPGAHSFQKGRRCWNVKSVNGYCAALRNGQGAVEGEERLTDDQLLLERLYFGFRTLRGLDLDDAERDERSRAVVHQLIRSGLVRRDNGRLVPTVDGYLVADSLPLLLTA